MSKLLSDRIKKISPADVSEQRYEFIRLSETEPDLGVPPDQNAVVSSELDGTRKWLTFGDGLDVDSADNIVVDVDTDGFFNSTSSNLNDVLVDLDNAIEFKEIVSDETVLGLGNSIEPLSIGQSVKPTDDVEFNSVLTNSIVFIDNPLTSEKTLEWDNQKQTLSLNLSTNTVLSIGQNTIYLVKNTTGQLIPKGALLAVSGFADEKITVEVWSGS